MLVGSVFVVVATLLIRKAIAARTLRTTARPAFDVAVALVAGFALGAPLVLPGLQVLGRSTRNSGTLLATTEVGKALPPHDLVHLLAQGYNGLAVGGGQAFGDAVYTDTAAYVGVIAISLAVLGAVLRWRRPAVLSFLLLGAITGLVVFAPPVQALFLHIPLVETVDWHRSLMILALCLAVLAGEGIDVMVRHGHERKVQIVFGSVSAACLVIVLALWVFGTAGLTPAQASIRRTSLVWPLVSSLVALTLVGVLAWRTRSARRSLSPASTHSTNQSSLPPYPIHARLQGQRRIHLTLRSAVCILLLTVETAFLIASGAQLWSSSPDGVGSTPAATSLSRLVGSATVGFGTFTCYAGPGLSALGILPNANILFNVHEYDFYDPVLPKSYLHSWASTGHSQSAVPIYNEFCPVIKTAAEARVYGIGFVLEGSQNPPPAGGIPAGTVGGERVFRIPGSSQATLVPIGRSGNTPPDEAPGVPISVEHDNQASWRIVTNASSEDELRLRLTDEPGWHATIDGQPLPLDTFDSVMLQARIPPGRHVVELTYWPTLFTIGLLLAAISAAGILVASVIALVHRRNR